MSPKHPNSATSPRVWEFKDYQDKKVTVSVFYNLQNLSLNEIIVDRDPECLYNKLYWGLGTDGIPDSTNKQVTVPSGTTTISKQILSAIGLRSLNDILEVQFTVGP